MKTRKALAVVLAVVMLIVPFAVSSFAAGSVSTNAQKTAYTDAECFNPNGLVVTVDGTRIEYSAADNNFRFLPALNETLTVEDTEVFVYYKNELVGSVPVTVNHVLGDLVSIDNGHGRYCLGCGELHEFEEHVINDWIPNDDGGIFSMQSQTGTCEICGGTYTEKILGSEGFAHLFDFDSLTTLETTIVGYIYSIAVSLIQMVIGIY